MSKVKLLSIVMLFAAALCGCGKGTAPGTDKTSWELLHAVPSDAIAVFCFEDCSRGLSRMVDSTDRMRQLDLGRLRHSKAVLAYEYVGSVSPILLIETKNGSKDAEEVADLAQASGMMVVILNPDSVAGHHSALLIANSAAVMSSVAKHVGSDASILDAPGFPAALAAAGTFKEPAFIRHSSIARILPKDFMEGFQPRSAITDFLKNATDWSVFNMKDPSHLCISAISDGSASHYQDFAMSVEDGRCRLGDIMPADADYAVSLPIGSVAGFREAYERYLDANVKLDRYSGVISGLEKNSGRSPLSWEREHCVKEVALICRNGERIALIRPARAPKIKGIIENPYRGFVPALYGKGFDAPRDSCMRAVGKWLAFGPEDALSGLGAKDELNALKWPSKANYVIYSRKGMLHSGPKGITMDVLRPE